MNEDYKERATQLIKKIEGLSDDNRAKLIEQTHKSIDQQAVTQQEAVMPEPKMEIENEMD